MSGSGGGDGGYEERQREIEAKKQEARQALNLLFGVTSSLPRPNESDFIIKPQGIPSIGGGTPSGGGDVQVPPTGLTPTPGYPFPGTPTPTAPTPAGPTIDREAYNKALAEWRQANQQGAENRKARNQLYNTVRNNAFRSGRRVLDEDKTEAARDLKFELFARGLAGGSEDINQNAKLGRTYRQGLLDLGAKADSARAGFRADDESTRLQLLQSIDAGMDQGSALSSAANQMRVAADRSAADAMGTTIGDVFDQAGLLYSTGQMRMGKQQAMQDWWNQMGPSGRRSSSGSGATGVLTRLQGE